MKIICLGAIHTSDCEFPLLREYQKKGIDWVLYLSVSKYSHRAGLFNLDKIKPKTGIYQATEYPELKVYSNYLDLNKVFIINDNNTHQRLLSSRLLWLKVYMHMKKQNADILHASWPLGGLTKILLRLPLKKVLTVHDPICHSNQQNDKYEKIRKLSFATFDKLILLSKPLLEQFLDCYNVSKDKIVFSKLGSYDVLCNIEPKPITLTCKYILFFGYISPYKGLEYLCAAMKEVHKHHPEVKLVIAGGGKIYFDWEPYKNLDYIILYNHFIDLPELAGLLKECEFSVCPYKDATQSGVVQTSFTMNVPMIVTNVGALPEVVKNGANGLVVPPCDSIALADAINEMIANPSMVEAMRDNIKNVWQLNMSWDPIAEEHIECYKALLQS